MATDYRLGHWYVPGGERNPAWRDTLVSAEKAIDRMGGVEMVHTHHAGRSCLEGDCVRVEKVTEPEQTGNEP